MRIEVSKIASSCLLLLTTYVCIADEYYTEETVSGYTYGYYYEIIDHVMHWYMGKRTSTYSGNYVCAISPKPTGDFTIGLWFLNGIRDRAFVDCNQMTSVTIPSGVTYLGYETFANCTALTNVVLPAKIGSISTTTFNGCVSLASFSMSGDGTTLSVEDGVLYDLNKTKLIKYPRAKTNECYTVPNTVVEICEHAFEDATNLVTICLSTNLTTLGSYAFKGCSSIKEIELPPGVSTIADEAFYGCCSMTNLKYACNHLNSIGNSALRECRNLQHFAFTNVYGTIGGYAFAGTGLVSVEILHAETGRYAFSNCTQLKDVLLPHGNVAVGEFEGCESLINVEFSKGSSAYGIASYAFRNCKALKNLIFNNGGTYGIGEGAFCGCSSLTNLTISCLSGQSGCVGSNQGVGIVFPAFFGGEQYDNSYCVQTYGSYTHQYAGNICYVTNYYVPKSLRSVVVTSATKIPNCAFEGCSGIEHIEMNEGIDAIGCRAFWGCWKLKEIQIPSTVNTFCHGELQSSYSWYRTTIVGMPFGGNCSIQNVVIPGSAPALTNLFASCQYITNVGIQSCSTTISQGFFANCTALESVKIPESVSTVGDYAFKDCTALESVVYFGNAPMLGGNNVYEGTPEELVSYVTKGSLGWDGDPTSAELPSTWPTSITGSRAIDYYIDPALQVVTPIVSPSSCDYANPYQEVTISCDDDSAVIYYTLDGSSPSSQSSEYTGPFQVYQTVTVKAIAVKRGYYASKIAQSTLRKADELSEAGNMYSGAFDNDATAPWVQDEEISHDGISSIRSGTIDKNGVTEMVTSIKKAGTISFWWRAKCEEPDVEDGNDGYYDFATFLVDGSEVARIAGEDTGWKLVKYTISTGGKHELKWRYQKDGLTTFSPDCVWVDQIQWEPADGSGCTYSTPTKVPFSWLREKGYDESNFEVEANQKTGKTGSRGQEMSVWCDYLQGTDPFNLDDKFTASIEIVDGKPVVDWYPYLNTNGNVRTYRIKGKEDLLDNKWVWPADSTTHRFFRIDVEPYDSSIGSDAPGGVSPSL